MSIPTQSRSQEPVDPPRKPIAFPQGHPSITLDVMVAPRYVSTMIKSFKGPEAEKIFRREYVRNLSHDIQRAALRKLWMLDAAPDLGSLRVPPGNRLEALSGNRTGQHSIRINDQWRICFRWREGNAHDVEIVNYHQEK